MYMYLVKVVHHETNVGISHLLYVTFSVHPPSTWRSVNSLNYKFIFKLWQKNIFKKNMK
jgi:hypothetical protein